MARLKSNRTWRFAIVAYSDVESDPQRRLRWGDFWVKERLARVINNMGHEIVDSDPDVLVHLFGVPLSSLPNDSFRIVWIHSHPDLITRENLSQYHEVFCLSPFFAERIASWGIPVRLLFGFTDFEPISGAALEHEVVFVGNAKGKQGRKIIQDLGDLTALPFKLEVWGEGWHGILPEKCWKGLYYPNEQLNRLYATSMVVLNDHHLDMRREGFINPRILDVLGSGGVCVSDPNPVIDLLLPSLVTTYCNSGDLLQIVIELIKDSSRRHWIAENGPKEVRHYTSAALAQAIVRAVEEAVTNVSNEKIFHYIQSGSNPSSEEVTRRRIDLGCGRHKRPGCIGLDITRQPGVDVVCDLRRGIPLKNDSVNYLIADNVMEHIGDEFLFVMNEIWRVCKETSSIHIIVPSAQTTAAFQDPTHRRFFVLETFDYFDAQHERWRNYGSSYGIRPFRVLKKGLRPGDRRFIEVELSPKKSSQLHPYESPSNSSEPHKAHRRNKAFRSALVSFGFVPNSTAGYLIRALRRIGLEVRTCGPYDENALLRTWKRKDISRLVQPPDVVTGPRTSVREVLRRFENGWHPDFFLWVESSMAFPNFPTDLDAMDCPRAAYFIDSHTKLEWHLRYAPQFDYVFVAQKAYLKDFEDAGCSRVIWLPLACDPEIHGRKGVPKDTQISFVGNLYPGSPIYGRRNELIEALSKRFQVRVEQRFFEEMAESFSRAYIVFNCSARNDMNMRVFEAMASGSMLLTDEAPGSGLTELFEDGRHLVIYRTPEELLELAEYYLSHPEEAEAIGREGEKKVLQEHTYLHRVKKILEHLG